MRLVQFTPDRRRAGIAGATAAMTLAAIWSPVPAAGAQGPGSGRGADRTVTDLAVRGLGGQSALRDLRSFRLRSTGSTFIFDEGLRPGNTVSPASTFRLRLNYDLRRAGDRLRADYVRTSLGVARPVSEVISGRRGFITGVDANGSQPAAKPMSSDRWAAILREQRLLNPQLYVRQLLSRPGRASALGTRNLLGRPHRVLLVRGDVAPVRLYVDARSGRIHRLTTVDHSDNRGDVRTVVDFRGWQRAGRGVAFPRRVTLREAGRVLHRETRSLVRTNPTIAAARFRIPASITPAPTFDAALADRGARTTEWLMSFAHFGFIKDGPATEIVPRLVAPGNTLIQGIANQTMIVEQQDGIVVVEGALSSPRAEALIRYIQTTYPNKPIRFVTGSHHHADHSGGMRPFVALGARPVVHTDAVPFFTRVFANRSSRLLRDRLDRSTATADILPVPATGTVTLPDPVRPVTVLAEPTQHATSTILVFVPREGVLFVNGDTYTPGAPAGPGAVTLDQTIRANNLNVSWIVGGHGGVISYADFQKAIAAL
jgi:glyoxylase-like metal-dependent hydrolase (beta-lactamase superfamily II)